jgi:hypothetical protein
MSVLALSGRNRMSAVGSLSDEKRTASERQSQTRFMSTRLAPARDPDPHQFADALVVDRHKRIGLHDAARGVGTEEAREELRRLCELARTFFSDEPRRS